ncbi:hypothetical protein QO179_23675 [Bacillus stercoris]|nr:hypothetical protein [Bacillus stercoris]
MESNSIASMLGLEKFLGKLVKIAPESRFRDQNSNTGVIQKVEPRFDTTGDKIVWIPHTWFRVRFEDGYTNSYQYNDLIFLQKLTNKEASKFLLKKKDD